MMNVWDGHADTETLARDLADAARNLAGATDEVRQSVRMIYDLSIALPALPVVDAARAATFLLRQGWTLPTF